MRRAGGPIGVGDAEAGEDLSFQRFHDLGLVVLDMVVAHQVQGAVNHHMSVVIAERLVLIAGLVDYAGRDTPPRWPQIFLVGLVTSVLNSLGQSFVFSGQMAPEHWAPVMTVYALGDVIGLCLVVLGMVLIRRALRAG